MMDNHKGSSIEFEQLEFYDAKDDTHKDLGKDIKAVFLKHYVFYFNKDDLKLKKLVVEQNRISCDDSEKSLNNAFSKVLNKGFRELTNAITSRRTVYIHQNSLIPLIGTNVFGIVDRNTNCIEIKPLTGCNLNCIYCSVDEGNMQETRKVTDYIVEKDYLVSELRKLLSKKNITDKGLEIHIGPQGEPLLYPELAGLIKDMAGIPGVKRISMDTNGLLLSNEKVDSLVNAGLTRFNISLNSMNKKLCDKLSNRNYNLEHLKKVISYIEEKYAKNVLCEIIIAPVLIPGFNDSEEELGALIKFAQELSGLKNGIKLGIQNFLNYPGGRNPSRQKGWDEFYELLKDLEKKYGTRLILDADDFNIEKNNVLRKPFEKDDVVMAEIRCPGPAINERIAVSKERCITIHDCDKDSGLVRVKLIRDKHNVFDGILVKK